MNARDWRAIAAAASCLILVLLAGCGGPAPSPGPVPYPVRGQVVYSGQPAAGFRVAFYPLQQWQGPQFAPSGITDANGEFQLRSFTENDGAPAGEYAVTFTWPQEVSTGDPDDAPRIVDRLHGALSRPEQSKFHATVHEGDNKLEPFVLP
jgi:hypothetical protein